MKSWISRGVAAGALGLSSLACGYEITTHALITDHALRISVLNPSTPNSIVPVLGFDRLDADYPFSFISGTGSTPYRDEAALSNPSSAQPSVGSNFVRYSQPQEGQVLDALVSRGYLPGSSGEAAEQRVRSWLVRGAVREDDNDALVPGLGWKTGDLRDADPFGPTPRATRHFYDPLFDRAYDYPDTCAVYTCVRSILWALGRTAPLTPGSDTDDTGRRNHFTWQDARNNYWWALVLKRDSQGNGYDVGDAVQDSYERSIRWATTINDIGHVIHLLQDTAQPQHVRNDAHAPPIAASISEGQADAAFEAFTDYRVLGNRADALAPQFPLGNPLRRMRDDTLPTENSLPAIRLGQPNYYPGGGGHVQFSTPVKFFTTRHVETGTDDSSLRSRRGLADMSNRSFFTAGTLPGFRECQPPGTIGCVPTAGPTYPLPPNDLASAGYIETKFPSGLRVHERTVLLYEYAYPITDALAPNYDSSAGSLTAYGGKAPLATKSIWRDIVPDEFGTFREEVGTTLTYNNMRYMADVMVPRAVGYSAGMIDFFFRGSLKIERSANGLVAVLNQGVVHSMNAAGFPCVGSSPSDGCPIFGFKTVRLKVHNTTPSITESGSGTNVPQAMSDTVAGDIRNPAFSGPMLVAVARYHRNACYTPQLAGVPVQAYSGTVTNPSPTCAAGQIRTDYQEISVSKSVAVSAGALNGSGVDLVFDFSSDPIPVNATDLFIQVAYRGPLGEESDAIAVGTLDVPEPTFVAFWNNTDYFINSAGNWNSSTAYPYLPRLIEQMFVCAAGREVYRFIGTPPDDIIDKPLPDNPGAVRLALLFIPNSGGSGFALQARAYIQASNPQQPTDYFYPVSVEVHQANVEHVAASVLASPSNPPTTCNTSQPSALPCWRSDPLQRRRGLVWGSAWWPFHAEAVLVGDPPDVDSVPLPTFSTMTLTAGGTVTFDQAVNVCTF